MSLLILILLGLLKDTAAGRRQRSRTHTARARLPNLSRYYAGRLRSIEPGNFTFSFTLMRGRGTRPLSLDRVIESAEWVDQGAVLTGTVTLHRPDPNRPNSLPLLAGHRVRCRVRHHGRWYTLWTMRCSSPEVSLSEATLMVELSDDLDALRRNRRDWVFRKTKRRKVGYFAHQVARRVGRREGVKLGQIAKGRKRIDKIDRKDTSGLDVVRIAYREERDKTGRRFVIRIRDGRLEVVPYRRNKILYVIQKQITEALLTAELGAHPVTVIEAKGRIGKGKDAKRVRQIVFRRSVVRRFGYVRREHDYGRVRSRRDLRQKAQRDLAKAIRPTRTAELTFPGIPFIRRGDGMRWRTREPGWHGREVEHSRDRTYVFVRAITHSVSSDGYTSTATVEQEDPFQKDRERRDREARDRAHTRRKARRQKKVKK